MNKIANRIKQLRKERNLTQAELAKSIDISDIAIKSYETGRREPNSKAMAALEDFFQVSGKYLRGETDERLPSNEFKNVTCRKVPNQEIGKRIRLLRKELGLTQEQLAEATGLSYSAISNYEQSFREPNSKCMVILENLFGVSGAYLRGETDSRQPCNQVIEHQQSLTDLFNDKDIELMLKLVNKEIMWAERLADTYDLSGTQNTNMKSELMKLAVKLMELKEKR